MTVSNKLDSFLGIEITREIKSIVSKQTRNLEDVLIRYNMQEAKSATTPMISNYVEISNIENTKYPYREAIGSLLYLMNYI